MTLPEFDVWYRARFSRTSSWVIITAMILADFIGVMLSFGAGFFWVRLFHTPLNFRSFVTYWPYFPIFIMIFYVMRLYPGVSLAPAEELKGVTTGSFLAHGSVIVSCYIQNPVITPVIVAFTLSFIFSIFIVITGRDFMHFLLHKIHLKSIPAVIFGNGDTGRLIVDQLLRSKKAGYIPVLILDDDPALGDFYRGIPIIHNTMIGPEIVKTYKIKMAIVAIPGLSQAKLARLMNYSVSAFRYTVLIPGFFNTSNMWMSARDFDGVLGFASTNRLKMNFNLAIKRAQDIVFVSIGGLILLPFLLIIALLIKATSAGPVLYSQKRLGLNGKHFNAYKFRSMVKDADSHLKALLESDQELRNEWESGYKLKNDPRITKIGKFLRRTSFDEFPQFINILKGEMSLVGPRPVVEDEIKKYGENYKRIFSVKPGLTGLWQISGRSDTNYMERISYDTYYLQSWSVWLDLWILYKTPGIVFRGRGAY